MKSFENHKVRKSP